MAKAIKSEIRLKLYIRDSHSQQKMNTSEGKTLQELYKMLHTKVKVVRNKMNIPKVSMETLLKSLIKIPKILKLDIN